MRFLVPGGCGFLGSNFVGQLAAAGHEVVVLDRLTDFGNLARLEGIPHEFVQGDVADAVTATGAADGCQAIVNFAAETSLDASALASGGFIITDVFGTHVLLEFARVAGIQAAKRTADMIPLCHPLLIGAVSITFDIGDDHVLVEAHVETVDRTGVEMEALHACATAALTIVGVTPPGFRGHASGLLAT